MALLEYYRESLESQVQDPQNESVPYIEEKNHSIKEKELEGGFTAEDQGINERLLLLVDWCPMRSLLNTAEPLGLQLEKQRLVRLGHAQQQRDKLTQDPYMKNAVGPSPVQILVDESADERTYNRSREAAHGEYCHRHSNMGVVEKVAYATPRYAEECGATEAS
jgi:hypothetical protein